MFRQIFDNMPPVVKNLLIINVLFFLAKFLFQNQGIYLDDYLAMHYFSSSGFEPYQIVTHFFMHADIGHIFFNMFALVVFGSHLERIWGAKRFLIFYFVTAIGASLLHTFVSGLEVYQISGEFFPDVNYEIFRQGGSAYIEVSPPQMLPVGKIYATGSLGASGAVYGLIMAFALLFPNTQFQLLFPPIPVKAKWLALALGLLALYQGMQRADGDSVAHFAHLGGMLFGFIMIKIWQRNNNEFY